MPRCAASPGSGVATSVNSSYIGVRHTVGRWRGVRVMMQEAQFLLTLGAVIMGCGCLGMLIVRLCSPGLQGTGWLSGAFAGGSAGAALLMVPDAPLLSVFAADIALLSSFVLLHVAVLKALRNTEIRISHGFVLATIAGTRYCARPLSACKIRSAVSTCDAGGAGRSLPCCFPMRTRRQPSWLLNAFAKTCRRSI